MAKSYFHDGADWRELVRGEQGEQGPVGRRGPQGPAIDIETGLPISVDTTVGTRVFVGNTMIYGDTGWREVSELIEYEAEGFNPGDPVRIYIRRENSTVWLSFDAFTLKETLRAGQEILPIPYGFHPLRPVRIGSGSSYELGSAVYTSGRSLITLDEVVGGRRRFFISWNAHTPWPASLPGSPA